MLTLTGLKSGQQVTNWSHTFLEGVHRAAKLLKDGEVLVGHGPLVLGPLDVFDRSTRRALCLGVRRKMVIIDPALGRLGLPKRIAVWSSKVPSDPDFLELVHQAGHVAFYFVAVTQSDRRVVRSPVPTPFVVNAMSTALLGTGFFLGPAL